MFERFLQKTIGNKTLVTYGTPSGTDAGGLFCHMQACLGIAGSRLSLAEDHLMMLAPSVGDK